MPYANPVVARQHQRRYDARYRAKRRAARLALGPFRRAEGESCRVVQCATRPAAD